MKILIIFLLTSNCISSFVKQNYPTTSYQNTNVPINFLEIQESENYLKFIWEEMNTLKITKNHRGTEEISEIKNIRSTCIKKRAVENSVIELDITKSCPTEEIFVRIKFNVNNKKEHQIYANTINVFVYDPLNIKTFEASYLEPSPEFVYNFSDIQNVYGSTESDRIYIQLKNNHVLSYYPIKEWKHHQYFSKYSLKPWHTSDDYWFKKSRKFKIIQHTSDDSIFVVFNQYDANQNKNHTELKYKFISVPSIDYHLKNKTFIFPNYEIKRNTKIGLAPYLFPLTIPMDILLSPVQLIYYGTYQYALIASCTLGFTCKTALG